MTEIKCDNCIHANDKTIERRGPGRDNVEYIKKTECALGFEISLGGGPGPDCKGDYFVKK